MNPVLGLTHAEAQARQAKGLANRSSQQTSRALSEIFISNFLNIANLILLAIVFILIGVGKAGDALVTGGVVFINILIGTAQEYAAKRKLDQIALLSRPKVSVIREGEALAIEQTEVVLGDAILFRAGDQAVVDGRLIADPARPQARVEVDESLLTGESDLVAKRAGDEVLSGSFAVVGEGVYIAEKVGDDSFAQKLTAGARQYVVSTTPLQRQISLIVRVLVVAALALSGLVGLAAVFQERPFDETIADIAVVISLIPQGLLLMITVAYALGALRITMKGALVQKSNAVESLSHVDVLCMDKTGTLTTNRILFQALHPLSPLDKAEFGALLGDYIASTGAKNRTSEALAAALPGQNTPPLAEVAFSSARKWSGASFAGPKLKGTYLLGAPEMILADWESQTELKDQARALANHGLRVLLFAHSPQTWAAEDIPENGEAPLPPDIEALGLISFSDELRPDVGTVLAGFRQANIRLLVISGDNPSTVAALAYQAGFDPQSDPAISGLALQSMSPGEFAEAVRSHSIFGRITPEQKSQIVDVLRGDGAYVAMMGDGVNDVLSLKKAQVGIAMEDGSAATRAVADIVLLGNRFEILPQAFLEGQRILNGMNDSSRLFLTRSVYIALLIITAGFIGSESPFSPRHNALLTSLPVGIPAFFLAYWAKTGQLSRGLIASTLEFVLPAGLSLFGVNIFLWLYYLQHLEAGVDVARTALTTASLLGALWCVIIAEHPRHWWKTAGLNHFGDRRRVGLVLAMLALFIVVMLWPAARGFFQMEVLAAADYSLIGLVLIVWAACLQALWRFDLLERLLIPNYREGSHDGPAAG